MKHSNYSISDAARKLDIEAHVLRYWEEELGISIPRNELGHRCYREQDLDTFRHVRDLKEEGMSLQEIKRALNGELRTPKTIGSSSVVRAGKNPDKLNQFREIMDSIISSAIQDNNDRLASLICENTSERIIKEMNYLFRTLDEDEEVRLTQLKAMVEASNGAKREIAAAGPSGKKHRLFGKKAAKK